MLILMQTILTEYQPYAASIRQVRERVFIEEQSIARSDEFDDRDQRCQHALVLVAGQPIATGRIDLEKNGKIGRVAVLANHRRQGVGKQIMQALENHARESGLGEVWFHAQVDAVPFYLSLGYTTSGEEFVEAGRRHSKMARSL